MVHTNKKRGLEILLGILLVASGSWLIYFGFFVSNEVTEKFRRFFLDDEPPKFIPSCVYIGIGMIYIICGMYGLRGVTKQYDEFLEWFRCISSVLLIVGFSFLLASDFNIIDGIFARLNNAQSLFYTESSYFRNDSVTAWEELQKSMRCCRNTSDEPCSQQITSDNFGDSEFVAKYIYVDGCFQSGIDAQIIMLVSGLGLVAAVLYCIPCSRKGSYNRFDQE